MIINRPNGILMTLSYDKMIYCMSNYTWKCTGMCGGATLAVHLTEKKFVFPFHDFSN